MRFVRQLPVVLPPLAEELPSSWLVRTSSYYRTTAKELLTQIGCIETSLEILDRSAGHAELAALAFALRVEPTELSDILFDAVPEAMLNLTLFHLGRNYENVHDARNGNGPAAVVWLAQSPADAAAAHSPLAPGYYRSEKEDADVVEKRSARLCASLELGLLDGHGRAGGSAAGCAAWPISPSESATALAQFVLPARSGIEKEGR